MFLFYQNILSYLNQKGFAINPYDPCVVKKIGNGKQMTVTWHVDYINISHIESSEVTSMMKWLESQYGQIRIYRGKLNNCLGMELGYLVQGRVSLRMGNMRPAPSRISQKTSRCKW